MSIQTELTRITNAKAAIKTAIEGKGVTVPEATLLDGMAALIEGIESGGFPNGTFTLTEARNNVTIEHNLGTIPSFAMYIIKNATASNNSRIYGCGGIPNVSYFRFGKTTRNQIVLEAKSDALTIELEASNPCWIGSLNEHTMDVGTQDGNRNFLLEAGVEYLWLVLP